MNLTEKQKELLNRRKVVALATASKDADPQVTFVEINLVEDDDLVFTDNQMTTARNNILENGKVVLMAFEQDYGYCLKLFGTAQYHTGGERFEYVKHLADNEGFSPRAAVVITIEHVIEFS
ncbi:MAG: hypothetical protein UX49_C0001G0007 [Candidatus Wolfebacteria bacterium GW2011_GWC2_46_275]|uniref:Pyridoxamine 5'-phosphate oxidase N-terminal domain-containing protein n=2 Tax=Candidatus Wolfeibacteriota TaxID=1752735 RepID=A0A0G1X7G9_9BACT|nr:MAG: hypothetical protein UX70_C0001G0503 [Candidatus Wolfebacteria bacterium GW2011_GWB1_47_1]KKU37137.1 MAG: hypothetical protein UX49_C0001G0007 [Candidatus Wolfebacteria bacterium GW2011_GWC2_46_275]KKU42703.1 MAG: hypothetical protein UX58_C0001G0135 [Candidatus Wolfebacteria bacterium GW2011_GWB2_46_69]KKU54562.1 MAG: hypothetical protein UX76_C0001G0021 [Candidatus Wolfebacteria bacterium GW2011_GWC1_47_103]KKU59946.1 MAG: hypothetical protein UX83_C0001G0021 [Candidatus Wolfebacteria